MSNMAPVCNPHTANNPFYPKMVDCSGHCHLDNSHHVEVSNVRSPCTTCRKVCNKTNEVQECSKCQSVFAVVDLYSFTSDGIKFYIRTLQLRVRDFTKETKKTIQKLPLEHRRLLTRIMMVQHLELEKLEQLVKSYYSYPSTYYAIVKSLVKKQPYLTRDFEEHFQHILPS
jgi:hypothetical protein